ncbi:MAG: hypothetical protein ACK5N8_04225 [Alphaproteobacteria bacterium]
MKKQYKTILAATFLSLALSTQANAQTTCAATPDCASMGYNLSTPKNSIGWHCTACPLDPTKFSCTAKECLPFEKTEKTVSKSSKSADFYKLEYEGVAEIQMKLSALKSSKTFSISSCISTSHMAGDSYCVLKSSYFSSGESFSNAFANTMSRNEISVKNTVSAYTYFITPQAYTQAALVPCPNGYINALDAEIIK